MGSLCSGGDVAKPTCSEYEKKVGNAAFQFAERIDGGMELSRILLSFGKITKGSTILKVEFNNIDGDGDGSVSLDEMMASADHFTGLSKDDIKTFFNEADIEHKHKISYEEFVVFYSLCYLLKLKNSLDEVTMSPGTQKKAAKQRRLDELAALEQVSIGKMNSGDFRSRMNRLRSTTVMSGMTEKEKDANKVALRKMYEIVCGAWHCFDVDNDGILTVDELQSRLHSPLSRKGKKSPKQHQHSQFFDATRFKEMDTNGNGSVTFPEFLCALMRWASDDEEAAPKGGSEKKAEVSR